VPKPQRAVQENPVLKTPAARLRIAVKRLFRGGLMASKKQAKGLCGGPSNAGYPIV
jgi:hypothetical protein